ncbi:MAG TPA: thiolase family protein [Rhodospirillales bacterium]|jgi:acetyl-CoA acetyltransferase|nr:thiolase family protein [Rhodospirillales bacterium]HIL77052.1 thiolase family protein [Rhodospirillales bacterium]
MSFTAQIPYGAYWSTPFSKWQGTLSHLHSIEFGAHVAKAELLKRNISPEVFDYGVLGITVPQHKSFHGLPWFTGMIGAPDVAGPTISQVCATSVRCIQDAVQNIECDMASVALVATMDRVSNGPQLYYPAPSGIGGTGSHENLTLDNMQFDPLGGHSMLQTAENVAARHQITTEQQHDIVTQRQEQYQMALANDSAFLKRFMSLPFDVPSANFKKTAATMEGDEGVFISNPEKLATLKPVLEGGTVTYGGQTYPTDGSACMVVTTPDKADELSRDKKITIKIRGFGMARAENGYMPEAPVPAAQRALVSAGLSFDDLDAVKTHNPFAVNDVYFIKQTGYDSKKMNNYGCTLIWGHPQGPMGVRGIIELIEELVIRGGGIGLFTGCAAGDTGMSVVIEVGDK